ncbi:MAG: hypothetical protein ACP5HC_07575 [Caldisericum sp.]
MTTDWDYLEKSDNNRDGRITTETIFDYTVDSYKYPPPYFNVFTGSSYLVPSYREEY